MTLLLRSPCVQKGTFIGGTTSSGSTSLQAMTFSHFFLSATGSASCSLLCYEHFTRSPLLPSAACPQYIRKENSGLCHVWKVGGLCQRRKSIMVFATPGKSGLCHFRMVDVHVCLVNTLAVTTVEWLGQARLFVGHFSLYTLKPPHN